jgi:hypothetical protein
VVAPVVLVFVGLILAAALISRALHSTPHGLRENRIVSLADSNAIHSSSPMVRMHSNVSAAGESVRQSAERRIGEGTSEQVSASSGRYFPVERVSDLDDLISGSSPETKKLGVALASLESSDKKIRTAALEAVRGLDDREAVPRLENLAAQTDDADEKAALLDTANFLNLPSFTGDSGSQPVSAPVEQMTPAQRLARSGILPRAHSATPTAQH